MSVLIVDIMDTDVQKNIIAAEKQIIKQSKRIEFYLTEYSIELLVQKLTNGDFFIPSYQREFVWDDERQCRFIESIIIGLPIPFLFFWEDPSTGKLEIVDGSQRLRTLRSFLDNKLTLHGLKQLDALEGLKFKDLLESRQRKIKNKSIRGIVLNEHADEQARFDLFDRINTGSKMAKKAEVRRGALGGLFMDMVIDLAQDQRFIKLSPLSKTYENERVREELVTRFFAFAEGLEGYKDNVAQFVFDYTKLKNEEFTKNTSLKHEYEAIFHETMIFIEKNFPWGFRKTATSKTTPRTRFEAIALGVRFAIEHTQSLRNKNIDINSWIEGDDFKKVTTSGAANVKSKLINRIDFVKQKILESSND